jgi:hypothetical protein
MTDSYRRDTVMQFEFEGDFQLDKDDELSSVDGVRRRDAVGNPGRFRGAIIQQSEVDR